ncbi:hypothetical protein [Kitasatospora sp. MBT66]|uniref:hypothetical protein n=1 Tax=Kitasatospora sp. MBT66 TaxID=1444769 RepID=UPI001E4E2511|nr:hypothetical protein [Kitasatospora sp. MBT66]
MAVSTVARWEAGATDPQGYIHPKLAKALRITPERLAELLAPAAPHPCRPVVYAAGPSVGDTDDMKRREILSLSPRPAPSLRCRPPARPRPVLARLPHLPKPDPS